ncbi:hypothetical protein [Paenibacillus arenosi]|uniref:DUF3993 domain-containing protein n=1 Tax=Paenibacillus arenosi TaxID=2774142 RepID=A0ABR9ATL6_9BACL|nr:hypothetical protein [Paenibacillus arenosi]MBD8497459.1 hypothetical protein [Paenibacillus arenosi]
MVDAMRVWLALMLVMLLLFIFPLRDTFQRHDELSELVAMKVATAYVDAVRDKGVITPQMWKSLMEDLHRTGYVYDIEMEHYEKHYVPTYTDPVQHNSFQNEFMMHYQLVHHKGMMNKLFPNTSVGLSDSSRLYRLKAGDYFQVTLHRLDETRSSRLTRWLTFDADPAVAFSIPIGGMVRNETH